MIFGMIYHNFYYICKKIKMTDRQQELLMEMVLKINEARTYNAISAVLTLIWIFEFFYTLFWIQNFSGKMYWIIWVFCVIGWVHMNRKFKKCMDEYKKLSEEYENLL